ncbi:MAG: PDZ domain-containing protein [Bdellovibrio sp.]|nr:PDZ domain-containing protein [Bdellovibrio sp.]
MGVGFKSSRGDRYLEVRQIQPKSPAAKLLKDGLRVGTVITQIDSKDSADLDTWQVIRYLSGDYGSEISLQWETKDGTIKMAPLKVR